VTEAAVPRTPFHKYEGLGNDFVVVEAEVWSSPDEAAARWCDRHFGVGADGVLVVSGGASPRMEILNPDGSRPEMCGNGLRCAAAHLRPEGGRVTVDTPAGVYACEVERVGASAWRVSVPMGKVRLGAFASYRGGVDDEGAARVELDGGSFALWLAEVGNPHAVWVTQDAGLDLRAWAARWGQALSTHEDFAQGVNASFARVGASGEVELVVYERGAGLTLACGTGACATAAVLASRGLVPTGAPLSVRLPGGPLSITVSEGGSVQMLGPARKVFEGAWAVG
jgi:diaminopimelate epimerase